MELIIISFGRFFPITIRGKTYHYISNLKWISNSSKNVASIPITFTSYKVLAPPPCPVRAKMTLNYSRSVYYARELPLLLFGNTPSHLYRYYAVLTSICTKLTCEAIKVGSEADMEPRTGNLILCNWMESWNHERIYCRCWWLDGRPYYCCLPANLHTFHDVYLLWLRNSNLWSISSKNLWMALGSSLKQKTFELRDNLQVV